MENRHSDVIQVVHDYMSDPETAWVIGEHAVFARETEEEVEVSLDHAGGTIVTDRGSVRVAMTGMVRFAPVEGVNGGSWAQAALLCLRESDARMSRRTVLTELGSDMMAARPEDRVSILFDLGFGVEIADCCVRTADPTLCALLRAKVGSDVTDDLDLLKATLKTDRVIISRFGRIETFGGVRADVRPRLDLPAPPGYQACLAFVPPQQDEDATFDEATYGAFRVLNGIFADPAHVRLKEATFEGVRGGKGPESISISDEMERMVVRVGLRQLERIEGSSKNLTKWREAFDG